MKVQENRKRQYRQASTAVDVFNKDFVPYITAAVVPEYGKSYADSKSSTWRQEIDWSVDVADFLIFKSRGFIRLQNITELSFLKSLSQLMADYLSKYFAKSPEFKSRAQAKRALEKRPYDDFSYVRHLQAAQATARSTPRPIPVPGHSGR